MWEVNQEGKTSECSRQFAAPSEHVNPSFGAELGCKAQFLCPCAAEQLWALFAAFSWRSHVLKVSKEPCCSIVEWNLSLWPQMSVIYTDLKYSYQTLAFSTLSVKSRKSHFVVRTISDANIFITYINIWYVPTH